MSDQPLRLIHPAKWRTYWVVVGGGAVDWQCKSYPPKLPKPLSCYEVRPPRTREPRQAVVARLHRGGEGPRLHGGHARMWVGQGNEEGLSSDSMPTPRSGRGSRRRPRILTSAASASRRHCRRRCCNRFRAPDGCGWGTKRGLLVTIISRVGTSARSCEWWLRAGGSFRPRASASLWAPSWPWPWARGVVSISRRGR